MRFTFFTPFRCCMSSVIYGRSNKRSPYAGRHVRSYGVLRSAGNDTRGVVGSGLPAAALAGGIVFAALTAAGFTVEILYPAVLQRFGALEPDAAFVLASLTLSAWLYHYCQVGTSVMVLATSVAALGTGVLPRWLALGGFVVALLTLLHFLLPLVAALVGLLWIAAVSVLMLLGNVGATTSGRVRNVRS